MKNTVLLLFIVNSIMSCGSNKNRVATETQRNTLHQLIAEKEFEIISNWAYPLVTGSVIGIANIGLLPPGSNTSSVNLIGNTNYFKMKGDSIIMYLPFFGEQRIAGSYNATDIAIEYKGSPDTIEISNTKKKDIYEIKFTAKSERDTYDVLVTLFPNLTSTIFINSMHRTSISYRGTLSRLNSKE
ncbi:DUF4251 domain-containing protein [Aquimarina sp. U1-2]|uniref:DUF4251 domain-containing protein n=1 Tax=Aquimarina sp. U1-2 TaxID=2823141 RepID=UPI001AEC9EBE|nr:DUF4251 domain-containing protein [Aquimarina sp. U1-2]MBP2831923.1 DUF4251 domain-containing protein [Aquimarina sp. U1-2]